MILSLHQERQTDCNGIYTIVKGVIEKGLNEVASRLNYTFNAEPKFGFECTCDDKISLHFTKYEPSPILCVFSQMYSDVPSSYISWFEGKKRSFVLVMNQTQGLKVCLPSADPPTVPDATPSPHGQEQVHRLLSELD